MALNFRSTEDTWMTKNNFILNNGLRNHLPVTNFAAYDYYSSNNRSPCTCNEPLPAENQLTVDRRGYFTGNQNRQLFDIYNSLNHDDRQEQHQEVASAQVNWHTLLLPHDDLRLKLEARRNRDKNVAAANRQNIFIRRRTDIQNRQVFNICNHLNHNRQEQHEEVTPAQANMHSLLLPHNDLRLKLEARRNRNRKIAAANRQNIFILRATDSQKPQVFNICNHLNHNRQEQHEEVTSAQVNRHTLLLPHNDLRLKLEARRNRDKNVAVANRQNIFIRRATDSQKRQVFNICNHLNQNSQEHEEVTSAQVNRHTLLLPVNDLRLKLEARRNRNRKKFLSIFGDGERIKR